MGCYWDSNNYKLGLFLTGLLFVSGSFWPSFAQVPGSAFTVDTYAGSDYVRDGGPATEALLFEPYDVAVDAAGNLYIADRSNHIIRHVAANGTISTFAGTGKRGSGQENVPAKEADFTEPGSVMTDAAGNVYFATNRNRLHKVAGDGNVATFAGSGQSGYNGDGGQGVEASLNGPKGIAIDTAGNVYIADYFNHRVRRVGIDGVITTVAGTGERGYSGDGGQATAAQLNYPWDVAVDDSGNVFIADTSNSRIRRVAPDGLITTVAGNGGTTKTVDGVATDVGLGYPYGLHSAPDGTLHIGGSGYLVRVGTSGMLTVLVSDNGFAGDGGPAIQASVGWIAGLDVGSDGTVFLADTDNHRIRAIDPDGNINTVAGMSHLFGDGGPAQQAVLFAPSGADIDSEGNLYVAEAENRVIRKIDPSGVITTFAGSGKDGSTGDDGPALAAKFRAPSDVAIGGDGSVFVADSSNFRVRKIFVDGTISAYAGRGSYGNDGDGGPATEARMRAPSGIAIDSDGNLFIADSSSHVVRRVDPSGMISTFAGTGVRGFSGDGGPAAEAQLNSPTDVFTDASGNVYITDFGNTRIRRVDAGGVITTIVEHNGNITSAVIEPNDGFLFIDANVDKLLVAWANGNPQSFNTKPRGFAGDGGSAQNASFNSPNKLIVAPDGRIFVCDWDNHRVRVLTPAPVTTDGSATNAGSFVSGNAAAESILSWFGWNLAGHTESATSLPLPDSLGAGTTSFKDFAGVTHPVGNFYASGRQRNLYMPAGVAPGEGMLMVTNLHGHSASTPVDIVSVAPGIFTFNGSGAGVVAATGLRVADGGARSSVPITQYDVGTSQWIPQSIDLGPDGDQIYLVIYCTGLRGRTDLANVKATIGGIEVPVAYAGAQGFFVGLDQLNIGPIPRSLVGAGEVAITVTVDGVAANTTTIAIQ